MDVPLFDWSFIDIYLDCFLFFISKQCFIKHPFAFIFVLKCEHMCETNLLIYSMNMC